MRILISFPDHRIVPRTWGWIMKLFSIVLVVVASLTAQKSSLLAGAAGSPAHDAVVGLSLQNPSHDTGGNPAAQNKASTGTASVNGIVRRQLPPNAPFPNALVKMFPDPPDPSHPESIRSTRSDEWGNFRIENVPPGKYRIVAITGEGPENLKSEATIAAAGGTSVELSEKESKTLTLYLYAAAR